MEPCKAVILPLGVFLLWMLTSFLCHKLAKAAMSVYSQDPSKPGVLVLPAVVTLSQMLLCWGMVQARSTTGPHHRLLLFSHVLATLATNTSMALTFASSTLAVKMLEPATSALLQTLLLNSPMGWPRVLSLLLVMAGAVMYVGSPLSDGTVALATVLAFLSNVVLGVRNVTLKLSQQHQHQHHHHQQQHQQQEDYSLRSKSSLFKTLLGVGFSLALSYTLEQVVEIFPPNATYFLFLTLLSSFFHVTYSYVSTKIVLRYMSVVSHAVANIFKRVLVVLLLHVTGQRLASAWNWTGLALCVAGLCLYQRYKAAAGMAEATLQERSVEGSARRIMPQPTLKSLRRLLLLSLLPYFACIVLTMVNGTVTSRDFLFTQSWNNLTMSQFLRAMFRGNTNQNFIATAAFDWNDNMYEAPLFPFRVRQTNAQMSKPASPLVLNMSSNQLYSRFVKVERKLSSEVLNTTDYAQSLLLGLRTWKDRQLLINQDLGFQPARKPLHVVREFLRTKPLEQPFDTDGLSPYLTTSHAVIAEAQRLHLSLFRDLLAGKKYAVLFGMASFENKGDPAISVAEAILLEKLGIELIFYTNVNKCNDKSANESLAMARRYPAEKVTVLMSGGGNLIGYKAEDSCRKLAMKYFKTYQQVIFSESIYMRASKSYVESAIQMYCCNSNLTILLRDRQSLLIAKRIFNNGTRLILAPDMAFHNGPVRRYIFPYYDVMWLKRYDGEKPENASAFRFPPNIRVRTGDWMLMLSLKGNTSFQKAVNTLLHGYDILQRGRVVITERLHGHILSVLLNIPHVLLDNSDLKLSSYYNTWTRGLSNCRLASSASQAVDLAMELLQMYNHTLPSLLPVAHITN